MLLLTLPQLLLDHERLSLPTNIQRNWQRFKGGLNLARGELARCGRVLYMWVCLGPAVEVDENESSLLVFNYMTQT